MRGEIKLSNRFRWSSNERITRGNESSPMAILKWMFPTWLTDQSVITVIIFIFGKHLMIWASNSDCWAGLQADPNSQWNTLGDIGKKHECYRNFVVFSFILFMLVWLELWNVSAKLNQLSIYALLSATSNRYEEPSSTHPTHYSCPGLHVKKCSCPKAYVGYCSVNQNNSLKKYCKRLT